MERRTLNLCDDGDLEHVALMTTGPHRPQVKVWLDTEPDFEMDARGFVVLSVGSLWGQGNRFVELSADEARRLAKYLTEVAAELDEHVGQDEHA